MPSAAFSAKLEEYSLRSSAIHIPAGGRIIYMKNANNLTLC